MIDATAAPSKTVITAIHLTKTRKAWSDEWSYIPMAWFQDGNGREEFREISQQDFDLLYERATELDYREADYISFMEPVEWSK